MLCIEEKKFCLSQPGPKLWKFTFFFEWILPLINLLSDDDETSGDGYGNYDNYDEADMKSVEDDDMDEASGSLVNCQAH